VISCFDGIVKRYASASAGFEQVLRLVQADQWSWSTPCTDWNVRDLVNHMTRGNLNYVGLLRGASAAEFLRLRDVDALGLEPVGAYIRSVQECANAFAEPGALEMVLDYPLGRATGEQLLAVRTTDTVVHTWDLARGVKADEGLDHSLVSWINENLSTIYAGMAESPVAVRTTHRFFAPAPEMPPGGLSEQNRLLYQMGRRPDLPH
jgi:uncharacterized protein (TIGR03086 family)